jgi:hypothetical protein
MAQNLLTPPRAAGSKQVVKVLHYIARMQRIEKKNDFNYSEFKKEDEVMKENGRR